MADFYRAELAMPRAQRRGLRPPVCLLAAFAVSCVTFTRAPTPGVDTFVSMERTECLGRCPIYTVTVFDDGRVLYEGRENAPTGREQRAIAPAEAARLMDAALRIEQWSCDPSSIATDYPQAIFTVSRGGRVRRIVYDHGDPCAPRAIKGLEGDIDSAGGHPQLVPSTDWHAP